MKGVLRVLEGRPRDLGGFGVRRVLPAGGLQTVGPFIFFDHMGPADFGPGQGVNVRPHPHIGLATVTYLFSGALVHRDSLGFVQRIEAGAVNWMTAGRGIVHSERIPADIRDADVPVEGVQTWVALPTSHEEDEPSFTHHPATSIPEIVAGGARLRVIAGTAFGERSPAEVLSPTLYVAAEFEPGASLLVPPEHEERAIYPLAGGVTVDGESIPTGSLGVLTADSEVTIVAGRDGARLMLLGGAPLDGPRLVHWNFVSSRRERIEKAKSDWKEERFAEIPGESGRIPLPEWP